MAVLQMLVVTFIFTECYARESFCKQFEYEEKMLNKMIRTEIAVEEMAKKVEAMEKKLDKKVQSLTDGMKANFDEMLTASSVDGGWTEWSSWTDCTTSCGVGTKSRYRSCDNPARYLDGQICDGSPLDSRSCENSPCQELVSNEGNIKGSHPTRIGFTAYGPSYKNGALTYRDIYSNVGDSFNKDTGKFVCKIPGLYYFSATIIGSSGTTSACYCYIKVGSSGKSLVYAHTKHTGDYPSGSGSLVYELNVGDEAYLGSCTNAKNFDPSTHFSGFLIH